MNNQNHHPVQAEPPLAHALHKWNEASGRLSYEYNGEDIIQVEIPAAGDVGFRHGSDGTMQSVQYTQQIYLTVDRPRWCRLVFRLRADTVCMRPARAGENEAILAQLGRPLLHGVGGLYDKEQDLLIDFHGCEWRWETAEIQQKGARSEAAIQVFLCEKPLFINLRMQYYRRHLGYGYHKPWQRRPKQQAVAGWCSWEAFRRDVDQAKLDDVNRFMERELAGWGLRYIQVDDGYQKMPLPHDGAWSMAEGWMACDEAKFPAGHEGIVASIREAGFAPAIWTNANITNPDFPRHHPEDVLWHGEEPLKGEWIDYLYSCLPETLAGQVKPIFAAYREKGYEYLKIDAIRHLLLDGLHEAVRLGMMDNDEAERRFRAYMEATREGLGEDVYYLASWGEMHEVVGLVDACRISMDANPTWAGVRMQLFETARWFFTQRVLFLMDPDHVCARTRPDWAQSVLSLISLAGGLYMLSDALDAYTPEKLAIIRKTLPPLESATAETGPLDVRFPAYTWTKLHGFAVQSSDKPVSAEDVTLADALNMAGNYPTMHNAHPFSTLWAFHLAAAGEQWCVMGRFATAPLEAAPVALTALGLDEGQRYHAFDFWQQKYLGEVSGMLQTPALPVGCCQIVALRPVQERPQLIASSRHVSMDAVSVKAAAWQGAQHRLRLAGVPGSTETYYFHTNGAALAAGGPACTGGSAAANQAGDVLAVAVTFEAPECGLVLPYKL